MTITKVYVQQLVNAGKLKDVTPEKKRNKKYISLINQTPTEKQRHIKCPIKRK